MWGGNPARLMEAAVLGEVEVYLSQSIIGETMRVLKRKDLNNSQHDEAMEYITAAAIISAPSNKLTGVADDPDDDKVVEVRGRGRRGCHC